MLVTGIGAGSHILTFLKRIVEWYLLSLSRLGGNKPFLHLQDRYLTPVQLDYLRLANLRPQALLALPSGIYPSHHLLPLVSN